ncbi:MAG: MFS transporter [Chitinophagaceae bacterium]
MANKIIGLYKNAYSGLSKKSWYLSIVMLINRSGTMVIPFMTIYCTQRLHFSVSQAGFIMALFGLGAIVGASIGGKIIDNIGFYFLQTGALFSGGLMFFVVGYLQTFFSLCIGVFILSVCNESFRPANSTAIAFYSEPENRTRSYSLNRLSINLGWAVGGALGGFLASRNYHTLFWVDGSTNIAAAILLLILLPRAGAAVSNNIPTSSKKTSAYRDKKYLYFIGLVILFATCFFQMMTMMPLFYKTEWKFDEQFIGILMAVNGIIITFIEMILIYNLEGKKPPVYFIGIGVLLLGSGFALLNILPALKIAAIISITIITFGEIFSMPFMNTFWISHSEENNRGQYAALYTIAWSIAQIAAPTLGSQIIQHFGFTILWWIIGAMCFMVYVGFMLMRKKEEKLNVS